MMVCIWSWAILRRVNNFCWSLWCVLKGRNIAKLYGEVLSVQFFGAFGWIKMQVLIITSCLGCCCGIGFFVVSSSSCFQVCFSSGYSKGLDCFIVQIKTVVRFPFLGGCIVLNFVLQNSFFLIIVSPCALKIRIMIIMLIITN